MNDGSYLTILTFFVRKKNTRNQLIYMISCVNFMV